MIPLRALARICTLKTSPAPSSSDLIAEQLLDHLRGADVECETVRAVDLNLLPGVGADMGEGDEWPHVRENILAADILAVSTPTWVGHMSSVAQRVLERLDAELSNTDDDGRPVMVGKVALAAVVGNEDGAHKIVADFVPGTQRHRLHDPGAGVHLLERRSYAGQGFQTIWTTCPRPWPAPPHRPPSTPCTWRECYASTAIRRTRNCCLRGLLRSILGLPQQRRP